MNHLFPIRHSCMCNYPPLSQNNKRIYPTLDDLFSQLTKLRVVWMERKHYEVLSEDPLQQKEF
jgi:hypothetical protein